MHQERHEAARSMHKEVLAYYYNKGIEWKSSGCSGVLYCDRHY